MPYLYDPVKKTITYKNEVVSFYCGPELNDIAVVLLDFHFKTTGLQETLVRLLIITKQYMDKNQSPASLMHPESERGVIHPPELHSSINSLLCKVNKVTSSSRHGLEAHKHDLTALANQQLDVEESFIKVGLL